ncbi:putative Dihydroneopterin aldolase and SAM-dependent methyltransferase (Modular protein) [Nitrospira japonica]|uniref:7,8-dihydroneopterin aldolase n=1 Tax=Nitrospira japonica TaxID=1325564 RepID=A0A1W1I728_9BACT|nr:dihydroneopterin aldolase [Nitrospira japonica]SLM48810.1 putative Dihydroneopterin aldolase and SAM-dependent methyltransferase (Modular protein) [Nitrospira japonica]
MVGKIVIERLEFQGRCGVTREERHRPQPLALDLELDCDMSSAAASEKLADTVDYAKVLERVEALGHTEDCALLERLAERILAVLFEEFPIERVRLWLRKLAPPVAQTTASVGLRIDRIRPAYLIGSQPLTPSRFLLQNIHRVPKGRVLDVACGKGRHALYLANLGFDVEAIDRDAEAVFDLASTAKQRNLPNLTVQTVDLERATDDRPEFPANRYDAIVVCFYLHRPLFSWLVDALKPNGVLLYETFTIDNYRRHRHPRRWEFCLAHNELLRLTSALQVLSYDEGEHATNSGVDTVFTAQLLARKAALPEPDREPA